MKSRVNLREIHERDRLDAYDLLNDHHVMKFIGPRKALSIEGAREWFDHEMKNPSRYVIARKETDELIGFCGVKKINGVFDFGYFLRRKYWSNGYATEACKLALGKLSSTIDITSIEIFIASDNLASKAIAVKLDWLQIKSITKEGEAGHLYAVRM
jgi:[ribosomal protein S5]-alanine N-acetyltransferase